MGRADIRMTTITMIETVIRDTIEETERAIIEAEVVMGKHIEGVAEEEEQDISRTHIKMMHL